MGIFTEVETKRSFKNKNGEDYISYFETIILGHNG
jgi:uncharacterized beta-barrel protein YwiB (DUF1934 family)